MLFLILALLSLRVGICKFQFLWIFYALCSLNSKKFPWKLRNLYLWPYPLLLCFCAFVFTPFIFSCPVRHLYRSNYRKSYWTGCKTIRKNYMMTVKQKPHLSAKIHIFSDSCTEFEKKPISSITFKRFIICPKIMRSSLTMLILELLPCMATPKRWTLWGKVKWGGPTWHKKNSVPWKYVCQ